MPAPVGNSFVALMLLGYLPICVGMFWLMPTRRAIVFSLLAGWLFLPVAGVPLPIPLLNFTKLTAVSLGVFVAAALMDARPLMAYRPRLIDLPMIVFCVSPFMSSVMNGLGAKDGMVEMTNRTFEWGLIYMVGRCYLGSLPGLRDVAIGIVIGALVYVPFCLIESRFSPQFHAWVYGFYQHDFVQTMREDGAFRPMVFMQHGLAVALFMAAATLVSAWMWYTGALPRIMGMNSVWPTFALLVTTIGCKSMGAVLLMFAGLGTLFSLRTFRSGVFLAILIFVAPAYMITRSSGLLDGQRLVSLTKTYANQQRADSLETRVINEDRLVNKALQARWVGWGGWGRARVVDEFGHDITITDGMWVIYLGNNGLVGLISFTAVLLVPIIALWWRYRLMYWSAPAFAPAVALSVVLVIFMIDSLANAMISPIFVLCAGSISGLTVVQYRAPKAVAVTPQRSRLVRTPAAVV